MMKMILGAAVLLLGCAPLVRYDYSKEPDPRKKEFVIGASDGLKITVWKNPDLSTDGKVRPDGTITMPLLGDLRAAGRTPSELKTEILQKLAAYIKEEGTVVSIAVTEVNSYRFTISGNVEHPGIFTAKYYVTVAEGVALAGGLNKFASGRRMVLIRSDGREVRRIPIDYDRVSSGEHPDENLLLVSGDTLFAP